MQKQEHKEKTIWFSNPLLDQSCEDENALGYQECLSIDVSYSSNSFYEHGEMMGSDVKWPVCDIYDVSYSNLQPEDNVSKDNIPSWEDFCKIVEAKKGKNSLNECLKEISMFM